MSGDTKAGLDLEAIRARVEAATPGPWEYVLGENIAQGFFVTDDGKYQADWIFDVDHMNRGDCDSEGYSEQSGKDAEFAANARQDIPALLAEIDRLTREVTEARCIAMMDMAGFLATEYDRVWRDWNVLENTFAEHAAAMYLAEP